MPELLERREADLRKQRAAAKRQAQLREIVPEGRWDLTGTDLFALWSHTRLNSHFPQVRAGSLPILSGAVIMSRLFFLTM